MIILTESYMMNEETKTVETIINPYSSIEGESYKDKIERLKNRGIDTPRLFKKKYDIEKKKLRDKRDEEINKMSFVRKHIHKKVNSISDAIEDNAADESYKQLIDMHVRDKKNYRKFIKHTYKYNKTQDPKHEIKANIAMEKYIKKHHPEYLETEKEPKKVIVYHK